MCINISIRKRYTLLKALYLVEPISNQRRMLCSLLQVACYKYNQMLYDHTQSHTPSLYRHLDIHVFQTRMLAGEIIYKSFRNTIEKFGFAVLCTV